MPRASICWRSSARQSPSRRSSARTVSEPLTLPMCSPIVDGAATVILVRGDGPGNRSRRSGYIRSSTLVSANADGVELVCAARAAERAYAQVGIGPQEVHMAEVHDASSPAEIMLY